MTKRLITLLLALVPATLLAAGDVKLEASGVNLGDQASMRRGAALYMNYCAGCHSLQYQRYSRMAEDLNLTEEQVMTHLNFSGRGFGETIGKAMDRDDGEAWFGKSPPDLSLVSRAKLGGPDWVYTFLTTFYVDESRPAGWNNPVLANASMPHVLWEMQGVRRAVFEPKPENGSCAGHEVDGQCLVDFVTVSEGSMSEAEYQQVARDLSAFLAYVAEPAALKRQSLGVWVLLFLGILTLLAWLLKTEYWRDVH